MGWWEDVRRQVTPRRDLRTDRDVRELLEDRARAQKAMGVFLVLLALVVGGVLFALWNSFM